MPDRNFVGMPNQPPRPPAPPRPRYRLRRRRPAPMPPAPPTRRAGMPNQPPPRIAPRPPAPPTRRAEKEVLPLWVQEAILAMPGIRKALRGTKGPPKRRKALKSLKK